MELLDIILDESRRNLEGKEQILDGISKRSGVLLAAIGLLLSILFNIFTNNDAVRQSSVSTVGAYSANGTYLFGSASTDIVWIMGESALFLVSAFCLVVVLIRTTKKQFDKYFNLYGRVNLESTPETIEKLRKDIIRNYQLLNADLDKRIQNIFGWYLFGVYSFLLGVFLLALAIITSSNIRSIVLLTEWVLGILVIIAIIHGIGPVNIAGNVAADFIAQSIINIKNGKKDTVGESRASEDKIQNP